MTEGVGAVTATRRSISSDHRRWIKLFGVSNGDDTLTTEASMSAVKCENCGERYDNEQGDTCPFCGASQPMVLDLEAKDPPRDRVVCENCGRSYNRDQGETCPYCKATQPMETNIDAPTHRVDNVTCENCGGRYVRTPEGKCPYCGADVPLEQGLR